MKTSTGTWLKAKALYVAVAGIGTMVQLFATLPVYSVMDRLLAAGLLYIFLFELYRYFERPRLAAPIVPMVTLQIYVMYGLPQFTSQVLPLVSGTYVPSHRAISTAMWIVFSGALALVLACRGTRLLMRDVGFSVFSRFPTPSRSWSPVISLFGIVGVVVYFLNALHRESLPLSVREPILMIVNPHLALVLVSYAALRYETRVARILRIAMTIAMVAVGMVQGMIETAAIPIFVLICSSMIWGDGLPLAWCTAGVLGFLLLQPVKSNYRQMAWRDHTRGGVTISSWSELTDRAELWTRALDKTLSDPFAGEKAVRSVSGRIGGLVPFIQVVEWVPEIIEHRGSEGIGDALLSLVPRVLWPNKPSNTVGYDRYAIQFRISTPEGVRVGTYGTYQPMDGYWDFGIAGAIVYLSLTGMIIGFLFPENRAHTSVEQIMGVVFSCGFFQSLLGLFNFASALIVLLVGSWIAFKLLSVLGGSVAPDVEPRQVAST
jgi:hypothetical protein